MWLGSGCLCLLLAWFVAPARAGDWHLDSRASLYGFAPAQNPRSGVSLLLSGKLSTSLQGGAQLGHVHLFDRDISSGALLGQWRAGKLKVSGSLGASNDGVLFPQRSAKVELRWEGFSTVDLALSGRRSWFMGDHTTAMELGGTAYLDGLDVDFGVGAERLPQQAARGYGHVRLGVPLSERLQAFAQWALGESLFVQSAGSRNRQASIGGTWRGWEGGAISTELGQEFGNSGYQAAFLGVALSQRWF